MNRTIVDKVAHTLSGATAPTPSPSPAPIVLAETGRRTHSRSDAPSRETLLRQHEEYLTAVGIDKDAKTHRRRVFREVLDALDAADGISWQERWLASNTEPQSKGRQRETRARLGMRFLLAYRLIQPGYDWLLDGRMLGLAEELRHSTDAEDLTRVYERAAATHIPPRTARHALDLVARMLIHTGRRMDELTTQDLLAMMTKLVTDKDDASTVAKDWLSQAGLGG